MSTISPNTVEPGAYERWLRAAFGLLRRDPVLLITIGAVGTGTLTWLLSVISELDPGSWLGLYVAQLLCCVPFLGLLWVTSFVAFRATDYSLNIGSIFDHLSMIVRNKQKIAYFILIGALSNALPLLVLGSVTHSGTIAPSHPTTTGC